MPLSVYDAPSFLPQPSVPALAKISRYASPPPHSPSLSITSNSTSPTVPHRHPYSSHVAHSHPPHHSRPSEIYVLPHDYSPHSTGSRTILPHPSSGSHSPLHPGAFRPFKPPPLSPPSSSVVHSFSPSHPFPRVLTSSPSPSSPVELLVKPLAVRRSPPHPSRRLPPYSYHPSCPTCVESSRPVATYSPPHPGYHQLSVPPSYAQHCNVPGCMYIPGSPRSPQGGSRILVSDDDEMYSHPSSHSILSGPSSSISSAPSMSHARAVYSGHTGYSSSHVHMSMPHPQPAHHHRHTAVSAVQAVAPQVALAYPVPSIPVHSLSPSSLTSSSTSPPPYPPPVPTQAQSQSAPSSPSPTRTKRTATHMREFVRSYFSTHASSLVNKDLTTISAELQAAYEKEGGGAGGAGGAEGKQPVFCRTFIQKVARGMGYMLTLNYGLVDKRMKHLMKIRKRGKKVGKKGAASAAGGGTEAGKKEEEEEENDTKDEEEAAGQVNDAQMTDGEVKDEGKGKEEAKEQEKAQGTVEQVSQ